MRRVRLGSSCLTVTPVPLSRTRLHHVGRPFSNFPVISRLFLSRSTRRYEKYEQYDFSRAMVGAAEDCKLSSNNVDDDMCVVELTSNASSENFITKIVHFI